MVLSATAVAAASRPADSSLYIPDVLHKMVGLTLQWSEPQPIPTGANYSTAALSDPEYDLPEVPARLHYVHMGVGGVLQRVDAVDDRLHQPALDQRQILQRLAHAAHEAAHHREMLGVEHLHVD